MDKGNMNCSCLGEGKQQDTKCESIEIVGGGIVSLSPYKIYCATCNRILDIVYHGLPNIPIVSMATS